MEFPLPQVQAALKPYIHPPSEALYIRQVVTQHLANLSSEKRITEGVGSADEFRRFLDYEVGRKDGVRKEYLEALRERAEVMGELDQEERKRQEDDEDDVEEGGEEEGGGGAAWIQEYLNTLKLTRQLERLEILQIYLRTFNDPAVLEAESINKISFPDAPPAPPAELTSRNPNPSPSAVAGGPPLSGEAENLVLKLEKRILETQSTLSSEQLRITAPTASHRGTRTQAFAKTRDALISWVESQLSHTSTDPPPSPPSTTTPTLSVKEATCEIHAAYESYLSAREELVEVLSWVGDATEYKPIATSPPSTSPDLPLTPLRSKTVPPPEILKVLGAVEELAPLVKAQKMVLSQKTFYAGAVAAERKGLVRVLESAGGEVRMGTGGAEMARGIADKECVAMGRFRKEVEGNVNTAKKTLEGVQSMLSNVERLVIKKKEEESRIPMRRKGRRRDVEAEVEKGFWGVLGGGVGVIGDGI